MSTYRGGSLEGLGGPIQMNPYSFDGIDPCLEDCCRRELEQNRNRRYNALTSTLRRHDVVAMAERRRRNLIQTLQFEGCRCCYDPNSDGGEYRALIEYKQQKQQQQQHNENNNNDDNDEENTEPNTDNNNNHHHHLDDDDDEPLTPKIKKNDNNNDNHNDNDDSDDDDEFDYLLDDDDLPGNDYEDQRRTELEYQMLTRQVALQHGYGTHRQLHPLRVLKAAGLGYAINNNHKNNNNKNKNSNSNSNNNQRLPPPAVVLHLLDPDSFASASLDYFLETRLAVQNPGTIFLRSGGRSTLLMDATLAQLALPQFFRNNNNSSDDIDSMLPALIAIRDGVAINVCPKLQGLTTTTTTNGNGNDNDDIVVEEHAVEHWLQMSGVLLSQPPQYIEDLCHIRPEEEALMEYMTTQKQPQPLPEEERFDCGLESCNKSFPHEHVGIKTSEQSGLVVKEEAILGK